MKRFIPLLAVIALYLVSTLALSLIYGPSYPFLAGEDCWVPDGNSGWLAHGSPSDQMPVEPSVNIPLVVNYLPIFLPAILMLLFMFTPLGRKFAQRKAPAEKGDEPPTESDTD